MLEENTKVIHVSTVHPTFDTRIFQKMCASLSRHGYEVSLVIPHGEEEVVDNIYIVPIAKVRNRLIRVFIMPAVAIAKALRLKGEVYHFHDPELLPWAWLIRKFGKKVIYDMHENVPYAILHKDWLHPRLRHLVSKVWKAVERVLLSDLEVILAERSYYDDYHWHKRTTIIQNFPRLDVMENLNEEKYSTPTLVYIGHVHKSRGSKVMLQVAKLLKEADTPVNVLFVGYVPEEHKAELEQYALDQSVKVDFTGALPPREAWKIASKCHLGFALLAPEPNYIGSYPTKMFEYMALEIPAVVSDIPLYTEVIDKTGGGVSVDPINPRAVFDAVLPLLRKPEDREKMGEIGRSRVKEEYSWGSESAKLFRLYEAIISST